jgi:NADPH2:quinone reductase
MRVMEATRFGGPEVLVPGEAPDPVAGPGEAVVAVSVADVLFVDTQIRSGFGAGYFDVKPPYVPGNGVAGEVISVGEGVDPGWAGRRVITHTGERGGQGGYAEKAVARADRLIPVPDSLGLREAAALLHDGPTALGLAERAQLQPGDWVLVLAAGGGMGLLLLQLAHAAGARVIAAARGQRKLDLALQLGADAVADYSEPGWTERVAEATGGAGPDVVFDGVGGQIGRSAFEITASGGQFSAHGAPSGAFTEVDPQQANQRGITVRGIEQVQFAPADLKRLAGRVLSEAAAGLIRPVIGQTFPLEQAAAAHAAIEARSVIGKTLLLV